ncbi:MAG: DUF4062 domain-containing protein [Gammaproteobacteria bacterium]
MGSYRLFISAVSNELGHYRREVARVLRRKGLEVRDLEHFSQGPATLIERLSDYIQQCDAVVLLVGERCGPFPAMRTPRPWARSLSSSNTVAQRAKPARPIPNGNLC